MGYGSRDGDFNPDEIKVFGDKVAIKKHEKFHEHISDGIFIHETVENDQRYDYCN
jgi:hypothetical protein